MIINIAKSIVPLAIAVSIMPIYVGCASSNHAVIYQHTTLGVNGGTNPETGNFRLRVGFKRDYAAVIPKVRVAPGEDASIEAGSTFTASRYSVKGLAIPEIEEFIVTGDAATALGATPGALDAFRLKK